MGVTVAQIESAVNGTGGGGSNGFDVGYQAFVAANDVGNEDLSGGQFSGVLGLALPANSVILNELGGSTSGNPDGAPFLDNLFGSGENAPQGRYFSLSLERIGDSRTKSSLGIGMFDTSLCPEPCMPNYSSVVTSSLGPLYWRIPLQGITAYTWPSGQAPANSNATTAAIKLPSSTTTGQSYPVVVLDSGGYQMLMGDRTLVDAIYAPFGGSRASDGNCEPFFLLLSSRVLDPGDSFEVDLTLLPPMYRRLSPLRCTASPLIYFRRQTVPSSSARHVRLLFSRSFAKDLSGANTVCPRIDCWRCVSSGGIVVSDGRLSDLCFFVNSILGVSFLKNV